MNRLPSLLLLAGLTTVTLSAAGPEAKYRAPRTQNGHPDLQGVWNFNSGVPLERPPAFAGKTSFTKEEFDQYAAAVRDGLAAAAKFAPVENVGVDWIDNAVRVNDLRTSLITYPENGRLPALVDGVQRMPGFDDLIEFLANAKDGPPPGLLSLLAALGGGTKEGHEHYNKFERCLYGGDVPFVPQFSDNYVQIIQGPNDVALLTDSFRRIVALDDRPRVGDKVRSVSGVSRGRWQGETLVVETTNFNDRTPSLAGAGDSRAKIVTERFTRISNTLIEYSATVVDPKTFRDRIELSFPMARVDARIYESACHEGNYSLANTLSAARKAEEVARGVPGN
jgi:hypothetical protein